MSGEATPKDQAKAETKAADEDVRDVNEVDDGFEDDGYEPLFEEPVTEDQLKGEDQEGATEGDEAADPGPEGDEKAESKTDEKAEPDDDKGKDGDDKPKEGDKPPAGYVEKAALTEARGEIKDLKGQLTSKDSEIETLRHENSVLKEQAKGKPAAEAKKDPMEEEFKDFKVLTSDEFEQLQEDDPDEAVRYLRKERRFEKWQKDKESAEAAEKQGKERVAGIVNAAYRRMNSLIPGLMEEGSEENAKLADFATENGIKPGVLAALTNPSTRFMLDGQNGTFIMGDGAAQMVELIHKFHTLAANSDPEALRKKIEAEVRTKIESEVKKKLLLKHKDDLGDEFHTLDEAPGSSGDEPIGGVLSEEELAALPDEKRRKYLGG